MNVKRRWHVCNSLDCVQEAGPAGDQCHVPPGLDWSLECKYKFVFFLEMETVYMGLGELNLISSWAGLLCQLREKKLHCIWMRRPSTDRQR